MSPQPRSITPDRGTGVPAVPAWLQAALLLCALVVVAGPAQAQPVLRYRVNQRGDFTAIGNVLGHDCRTTAPAVPAPVVGTVSAINCGFTFNDSAIDVYWRTDGTAAGTVANNTIGMAEASSQAALVLPAGAQVTYARLYWAASREYNYLGGPMAPDTTVTLSRVGAGGFTEDLNADLTWFSTRWPSQYDYQGSVDVTRLVGRYGAGNYRLSGVSIWPVLNQFSDTTFATWWMVVFYRVPTDPVRTLALYDDLLGLQFENTQITLGGFIIPPGAIDAKMGVVVYEGDIGDVGETFVLNSQTLTDPNNPSNNFFNGTKSYLGGAVSQSGDLPQHTGAPHSVTGLDLDVVDVTAYFSANQTSATARVTATSDIFWLAGFPTSITTLAPDFTNTVKTFRAVNPRPDGSVRAGDILEYTIRTTNQGNESSLNTVLTDPLPEQLQYVPGTLAIASGPNTGAKTDAAGDDQGEYDAATRTIIVRLGTNANATTGGIIEVNESTSITFQARVVPGPASTINNQAYIRARGATNPNQSTTPSTPTDGGPSGPTPTPIGLPAPVVTSPAEGSTVPDRQPTFVGTSVPGTTVDVIIGGVVVCTATTNAAGNWSCQSVPPLANGNYQLLAIARDSQGNVSEPTRVNFLVSGSAPQAPVISAPAEGSSTSNTRPPISGTAEPGNTVTVTEGGTTLCTAVANASGNWTCTPATALTEGPHTIQAVQRRSNGTTSPPSANRNFTVDNTAPGAPIIVSPAEGSHHTYAGGRIIYINGRAEPGSTVTVTEGGTTLCTAVTSASGRWQCQPTPNLANGPHAITARAVDAAGNTGPSSPVRNFTVGALQLAAPVINIPTEGSTTGDTTPTFTGTAPANSTVTVSVDGVDVCTATANASGAWSCESTVILATGVRMAVAVARDAANTAGLTSEPRTFNVDALAPEAPVIVTPLEGSLTSNTRQPISGTAEGGSTVTVRDNGGNTICTVVVPLSGNWSCTPTADLPEGLNRVTAVARDAFGNTGPASPVRSFTVDTSAPSAPVITAPGEGSTTGNRRIPIAGTAEAGSTVTVRDNGGNTICTATADASGSWTCTPAADLPAGLNRITAVARDAAGNTSSPSAVRSFTVATSLPAPVISAPAEGSVTRNNRPSISGTAEPGATVTVSEGGTTLCTATADANGDWNCTPATALADRLHTISAIQQKEGLTSPASPDRTFRVDTTAPGIPVIATPTEGSSTNNRRVPITGTAEAGSTVTVTEGGITVCSATADAGGSWSCTPGADLAPGAHAIVATATDAAGNTSQPTPVRNFTVDITAPAAPVIATPTEGSSTTNRREPIAGTAEANATVTVRDGGGNTICTATANASGNWSCTPTTDLPLGTNRITAVARDVAGNDSQPSAVRNFTVNSLLPGTPVINAPTEGISTNNNRPTISGTADPGSTVTVTENGTTICTATVNASGNWSCTPGTPLVEGPHAIVATASNSQGSGPASSARNFTVDSQAPAAPVINTPAEGSRITNRTPAITGTAEPGSTVTVTEGGVTLCTAVTDASGNWTCTPAASLAVGPHAIVATATDAVGNTSQTTPVRNFTIFVDSDGDGIPDDREPPGDTDGDGIPDANDPDSDNDGIPDGVEDRDQDGEVDPGESNPRGSDSDNDGIPDGTEDRDRDGTVDEGETSPVNRDSDDDGIPDGTEDRDRDGTVDDGETNPANPDSDNDGIPDGVEDRNRNGQVDDGELDPRNPDVDGDGLKDGEEDKNGNGTRDSGETDPFDADTDDGGAKDGEEVNGGSNPLNGDDDYAFAGFGCTSAGATPLLLPLALLLAVPRRRRQASAPSPRSALTSGLLLALLAVFATSPARAQGIDIQQYKPGPGVNDVLGVYGPKVGPHLGLHGGLSLNYARDPLGVLDPRTGAFVSRVVTDQFTADVLASVSLFDRFELGLALPITFQGGPPADGANAFFGGTGSGAGMGDLRLVPKALLLSTDSGLDVGIALPLSLPTAASQRFLGAGGVSVMPMVTAQWANSGLRVLANAGVRLQPEVQLRNLRVGNELAYALGAEVPVSEPLSVRASLEGALALNTASAQQVPLELLAAARYVLQQGLALQVGGGPGLTRGYGTPAFRLFASVGWTPPAPPPAPRATCAEGPEDLDGFQDEDGCVDPDNDQDGIADAPDICPNEAEVKNGYRDEDGCPDAALDDKAPAPAIAYAGDTDGDGLNDDQDRCAKQAEDKDDFEDFDGCPEPDNDKDGLADAEDKCPLEAETINGNQDEDGCPDQGRSKVRLDKDRIVILDKVYFATNKDVILERSFSLLEQVASVLRANPQIQLVRIEGHTDDQGADAKNLDLSQRRANGVRRYLIDTGIAPERLEAVGYGETRPTDTNKTAAGRENNRRVEFNIVKMAGSSAGGEEP